MASTKDFIFLLFYLITVYLGVLHCVSGLHCYCDPCVGVEGISNGTCVINSTISKCYAAVKLFHENGHRIEEWEYGCLPPDEQSVMQCHGDLVPHTHPQTIACCNDGDLCNKFLQPVVTTPVPVYTEGMSNSQITQIALFISISLCVVIFICTLLCLYIRYKRKEDERRNMYKSQVIEDPFLTSGDSLKELIDATSGSGSGLPLLIQRTIAKQISLVESVGKGRYGEVWKANWRGETIAVKIFYTTEEASWFRETELYQTVLLRHDYVLGFIAADIKGTGSWTQLFLITDYHPHGSLYDYLSSTPPLTHIEMLTLAATAMSGLCHLHTEIFGTKGKPGIAHRDIKSKNILVKANKTCCIADLGLAVRYTSSSNSLDISPNTRQGTKRYMSPEVVSETINSQCFDSYKQSDMYSFGLVLWEIARRCDHGAAGVAYEAQPPYYDCLPHDPSFEDVKTVVYDEKRRPDIPQSWQQSHYLLSISRLMRECWTPTPSARLTSLRVKKSLTTLLETATEQPTSAATTPQDC